VPPKVTAPLVADDGVNPVVPADQVVTALTDVSKVPDVGNVTLVAPVVVRVKEFAPAVVIAPPSVILKALFTPVPPFADGSTPVTAVVRLILPQLGATPTPPEISAFPVATSLSLANVVVVAAYKRSPTVYDANPVPPLTAISVPAKVTAPVVADEGVSPVVPADQDVTAVADVNKVPDVGNVMLVAPVVVKVKAFTPLVVNAPAVVMFPPSVIVNALFTPVPPLADGKIPVTADVRFILPHVGSTPTPPEISAFPVATSESLAKVVEVSAYKISPTTYAD